MTKELINGLIKSDCIKIGKFTLKSGETSKYYYDLKNIISNPSLIKQIGDKLYSLFDEFDIICGIPYGGLPIALYISITYNKPMIYIRDKVKEYGTGKLIEGTYNRTDRCVIIDDVITSGKSVEEAVQILKDKVSIVGIGVGLNRQQNYTCSIPVKAVLYKNDITKYLLQQITENKKTKLCFSADIEDPYKLFEILNKIGKHIIICKIHYDIINLKKYKGDFISDLIDCSIKYNFLIMEDRKFIDISYIINKQYANFCNWADLVTVHGSVTNTAISNLSGVLLVATMSNNNYNLTDRSIEIAKANPNNVIGFITQNRIKYEDLVCMTPGIAHSTIQINDQKYKKPKEVDTDYIIVGRALYNSNNIDNDIKIYL
jgi:uridine monophosphate synthetase